jgi:hypothetical protein
MFNQEYNLLIYKCNYQRQQMLIHFKTKVSLLERDTTNICRQTGYNGPAQWRGVSAVKTQRRSHSKRIGDEPDVSSD